MQEKVPVKSEAMRKGERMKKPITDAQFKTILKMVLDILRSSKDINEATEKVEALLESEEK